MGFMKKKNRIVYTAFAVFCLCGMGSCNQRAVDPTPEKSNSIRVASMPKTIDRLEADDDDEMVVKSIRAVGGRAQREGKEIPPAGPIVAVHLLDGVTVELLREVAGINSLQELVLARSKATNAGLKALAGLKSLQRLDLTDTKVTDAGLKELAGLASLTHLDLAGTNVTDLGLKELTEIKTLQRLGLSYTRVTNAGLKELAGLDNLKELALAGTKVTDPGLKALAGLQNLRRLDLVDTTVTATAAAELRNVLPRCFIGLTRD